MNKSEELAKLLKVPRMYILRYGINDEDFYILDKEQLLNYFSNHKSIYYKFHVEKVIYPDFTKPSNFVKLKEISNPKYVEEFLQFLTHIIKTNQLSDAEEFKNQAQQTDWEY